MSSSIIVEWRCFSKAPSRAQGKMAKAFAA
jgi:hypothetical protein